jgi:hypothetical protein
MVARSGKPRHEGVRNVKPLRNPFIKRKKVILDESPANQLEVRLNEHTRTSLGLHIRYFIATVLAGMLVALLLFLAFAMGIFG